MAKRRQLTIAALCLLCALAARAASSAQSTAQANRQRPNIVLILADDLGYGDLACYGAPDVRTPAIDALAAEGVRFTSFYTNGQECTPTRAALLTGRYQHRVGGLECAIGTGNVGRYDDAARLAAKGELGLPVAETSIAQMLKTAGYRTGITGKWHLGYDAKFWPERHGFAHAFYTLGGWVDYFHHTELGDRPMLYLNGRQIKRAGYLTDVIAAEAVNYIGRADKQPFFLYVPFTAPHSPYQGPEDKGARAVATEEEVNQGSRATYVKMIERLDRGVAEIVRALAAQGLERNTLVVFTSDNGGAKYGRNAPLSGGKGGLFEGGIRVPGIMRWPGVLPAGKTSDEPMLTMDLTASLARIAGAPTPRGREFDGLDVLKSVAAGQAAPPRTLYWRARRGKRTWHAVREGSLKYIARREGDKFEEYLFDLKSDQAEKNNLLAARQADAQRLKSLLTDWEKTVKHTR